MRVVAQDHQHLFHDTFDIRYIFHYIDIKAQRNAIKVDDIVMLSIRCHCLTNYLPSILAKT